MICLRDLIDLWGEPISQGSISRNTDISAISTDSRLVKNSSLFIPLIGEKYNGHDFLNEAYSNGAIACVIERSFQRSIPKGFLYWVVNDTLEAYQQVALLYRSKLQMPVIAITGSAGKTTTREIIVSALKSRGSICSSVNNNNNDLGVPLTLLSAKETDAAVVIEMGMRGLGEIRRLSCCSKPDIAVITNIGSAHIGRLGSRRNIAIAKCEIASCLNPSGLVVIQAGEPLLEELLPLIWKGRIIRVALKNDLNLNCCNQSVASIKSIDYVGNVDLTLGQIQINKINFNLPLDGLHNARNFLLAFAVAKELDIPLQFLNDLKVEIPLGRNGCLNYGALTVLDESYNSSPEAVRASFDLLVSKPGRHFAVIGTMLELGEKSVELHRKVAEWAVEIGLDGMVIVSQGKEAEEMAKEAKTLPNLAIVSTPEEAAKPLNLWLRRGDVLLVKGSRSIELERLFPLLPQIN